MNALQARLPALADFAVIVAALAVGWIVYRIVFRVFARMGRAPDRALTAAVVDEMRAGARILFPVIAVRIVMPTLDRLPEAALEPVHRGLVVAAIAAATLLLLGAIGAVATSMRKAWDIDAADNLEARRRYTQVAVLERTLSILVVILGIGFALMTFPSVRQLGAGLLASAGVVGLVVGFAARPLLENTISGIQLALTQPIRVDDVVIIQGEWGRIEEITATYVVVKIWDERRLVVPFSSFIQQPFENWTRTSADILGTVFLWADYRIPVDEARAALEAIVHEAELWDGRVCNVQVVDTTEQAVKLRALVSASDSGRAWDLRVLVREKWLRWLQETHPECLPQARVRVVERAEPSADPQSAG